MSWFYTYFPTKETAECEGPVAAQANISQIPMIGNNDVLIDSDQQYQKPLFRPTDTKYIMLSKMGGRKDLLSFKDVQTTSKAPVSYPRCEWYYLEDNAAQDELTKTETRYVPGQPDYMVYDYERENFQKGVGLKPRERYPYAMHMDGDCADKLNMRIPEPRKFGTGVRVAKQKAKMEKAKATTTLPNINHPKNRTTTVVRESQPSMGKLLSNYYGGN